MDYATAQAGLASQYEAKLFAQDSFQTSILTLGSMIIPLVFTCLGLTEMNG